ncbi:hypothetical protein M378DRAFT_166357 [Amanita muscaria Koide BX008]|uniref:Uncharacterized protein n=1 Tax=Amanita muscaria (strain Koide BX008) TaxID=946122 RepID=A0A0C2WJX2_AMAMK|nr:hypothetical protein M378DRAFT_166357 [Amanita muscaria Koide BX008]
MRRHRSRPVSKWQSHGSKPHRFSFNSRNNSPRNHSDRLSATYFRSSAFMTSISRQNQRSPVDDGSVFLGNMPKVSNA